MQGEGYNCGKEFLFLRLCGCNLKCYFCDTKHEKVNYTLNIEEIYKEVTALSKDCKNLLITGGEPSIHELIPILKFFKDKGWYIAVESNGTISLDKEIKLIDHLTISPKGEIKNKKCHELRVINCDLKANEIIEISNNLKANYYFISPMYINGNFNYLSSLKLLGEINNIDKKHWYLSLQMHKFADIL